MGATETHNYSRVLNPNMKSSNLWGSHTPDLEWNATPNNIPVATHMHLLII